MPALLGRMTPALLVALLLGALTSALQTVLPSPVAPLANSAGPWCLVAFVLARRATRLPEGALTCVLVLIALVAGYEGTSALRGFGVSSSWVAFWCAAALVVGPVLGIAAVVVRRPGGGALPAAMVLPALLVLEGVRGWVAVRTTTSGAYWVAEAALGLACAARTLMSRGPAGTPFADSEAEPGLDRNT